jgi:hypothetical protein
MMSLLAGCGSRTGLVTVDAGAVETRLPDLRRDSQPGPVDAHPLVDRHQPVLDSATGDRGAPDLVVPLDTRPLADVATPPDSRTLDAVVTVDARGIADTRSANPDSALDAGGRPADPVIYAAKDFGNATPACVQATTDWLAVVARFAEEDRRCWADRDCRAIGWMDNCGRVCPFGMNVDRAGEFWEKVNSYAFTQCRSCPNATYPACPEPRETFCNAGRCEFVPLSNAAVLSRL